MSRRRWAVISGGAVVVISVTALGFLFSPIGQRWRDDPAGGDPLLGVEEVRIESSDFSPPVIQVEPGTEVRWVFTDTQAHNVVGDGFRSGDLVSGSFEHTFETAGSYRYACTLHAFMAGRVVVAPQPRAERELPGSQVDT